MGEFLIPPETVDELAVLYRDPARAVKYTNSKPAVHGGQLLLALVDELRRTRQLLERMLGERGEAGP